MWNAFDMWNAHIKGNFTYRFVYNINGTDIVTISNVIENCHNDIKDYTIGMEFAINNSTIIYKVCNKCVDFVSSFDKSNKYPPIEESERKKAKEYNKEHRLLLCYKCDKAIDCDTHEKCKNVKDRYSIWRITYECIKGSRIETDAEELSYEQDAPEGWVDERILCPECVEKLM